MKLSINLRNWGLYSTRDMLLEGGETVAKYRRTIALLEEHVRPALS